jgi:hypothetical protein
MGAGFSGNFSAQYSRTHNSFSGSDITAVFSGKVIGEIQAVSYTISREKAPQYVMGRKDPVGFSRGKRGIAGSLVFSMFDRAALLEAVAEQGIFWANMTEIDHAKQRRSDGANVKPQVGRASDDRLGSVVPARAWYEDQIPPFTIVLVGINEYGHHGEMQIRGVEVLNVGQGISVDDMSLDQQMTFVATDVIQWRAIRFLAPDSATAATALANPPAASNPVTSLLGT